LILANWWQKTTCWLRWLCA